MAWWMVWFNSILFLGLGGASEVADGSRPGAGDSSTQPATTAEKALAPTAAILQAFTSDDPEKHVEGFAAWHAWMRILPLEQKRAATRFLARERWLTVVGDEVLYDMAGGARRLSAYKLLRRIDGQRVFPYFLWGIRKDSRQLEGVPGFGFLKAALSQSYYVKRFLRRHGDPTVIEFLPDDYDWETVSKKIERRWAERDHPPRQWEPFDAEEFVRDLSHVAPARRRLAIRALTTNEETGGIAVDYRYRPVLEDANESVRLVAAEALTVTSCPRARGRLKRMVEDNEASLELRRTCLYAVAHCRKARQWTAEWMIDSVPIWPAAPDTAVQACLVKLCPSRSAKRRPYASFLRRKFERAEDARSRQVVEGALAELPS